jgi:RNA polymerase sigma factor (sigma-70 family)
MSKISKIMGVSTKGKLSSNQMQSYEESGKSLELYMKQLEKLEPLSPEEQHVILKEFIDGGRVDKHLSDKLIITNQRLVAFMCKKYANRKFHYIDLIQEGNIGMMEALQKFDYAKSNNASFTHFAQYYIHLRVARYVEHNRYITHLGHSNEREKISYNLHKYINTEDSAGLLHISKDLITQISVDLNVKETDVEYMVKFIADNNYVTTKIDHSDSDSFVDDNIMNVLYDENDDIETKVIEDNVQERRVTRLNDAMQKLSKQEKTIIIERHLTDIEDRKSLKEIGTMWGISGERVRQIESVAMKRIQQHFKYDDEGA